MDILITSADGPIGFQETIAGVEPSNQKCQQKKTVQPTENYDIQLLNTNHEWFNGQNFHFSIKNI